MVLEIQLQEVCGNIVLFSESVVNVLTLLSVCFGATVGTGAGQVLKSVGQGAGQAFGGSKYDLFFVLLQKFAC